MTRLEELLAELKAAQARVEQLKLDIKAALAELHVTEISGQALSRRQIEVITLVRAGCSNKEIAGKLNISLRTAKFHVSDLLRRLQVKNRFEL